MAQVEVPGGLAERSGVAKGHSRLDETRVDEYWSREQQKGFVLFRSCRASSI